MRLIDWINLIDVCECHIYIYDVDMNNQVWLRDTIRDIKQYNIASQNKFAHRLIKEVDINEEGIDIYLGGIT